jgi:hypothetical protein
MLSFIKGFVSRVSSSTAVSTSVVALGRWGIQYDPKIIRIKIDQANEDHCGCCVTGDKALHRIETTVDTPLEEYLLPYVI